MRKVLSFVLVLTLVLSSFSMAFAGTTTTAAGLTDISGNANQDAIQVNYDLGIVTGNPDGTFLPEKAVTRAEFAAMLTRALNIPASALAGYTTTSFKDTAGYSWATPYLAFCQSKGMMLGDGNGNAMPGRTISVNEAMTMALRAIGYTANSSMLVGTWPANYVSVAQNNTMYDKVSATTTVDKASAAQIIYNLLTVQKVSVNSDGTTNFLKDGSGVAANLLNTNQNCTADKNRILGTSGLGYGDSIVNITKDLGAYGDAYLNTKNQVVAFTKHDSTALTGKMNNANTKFLVGSTEYSFGTNTVTNAAFFANGDVSTVAIKIGISDILAYASQKSDDGKTVTLNVNLVGTTIKDIYSVVAWQATNYGKAASDVQDDISSSVPSLMNTSFHKNDNGGVDLASFELTGVSSLGKIAKDNVVYVYESNTDKVIRKVAVGTETVQGTVDEVDYTNATVTVGGKSYDVAPATDGAINVNTIKYDSDGTFYLDAYGKVFAFDGTNKADTFGIVKQYQAPGVENAKVKLYTSADATTTYTFSDTPEKIDWTSTGATTIGAVTTGALIGYGLNGNGDISTIDNTATPVSTPNAIIKSAKVIELNSKYYNINSDAVVMTYDTTTDVPYSVGKPADLKVGTCSGITSYILDSTGNISALYVNKNDASTVNDAIYGVINGKYTAKNSDGNKVYKYTGFIDGTAFSYYTTTAMPSVPGGDFGVYGIKLDSSDAISAIDDLTSIHYNSTTPDVNGNLVTNMVIGDISTDRTVVTDKAAGNAKYTIASNAVVYKYDPQNYVFTVAKLSDLRKLYTVSLFVTNGTTSTSADANVVIYQEN